MKVLIKSIVYNKGDWLRQHPIGRGITEEGRAVIVADGFGTPSGVSLKAVEKQLRKGEAVEIEAESWQLMPDPT